MRRVERLARPWRCIGVLLGVALVSYTSAAEADLTSWISVGGGGSLSYRNATSLYEGAGAVSETFGMGFVPFRPVVLGGVLRVTSRYGKGTDEGLMVRATSGGFSRGGWGLAVDVGISYRSWGDGDYGIWPLQSTLLFGMPWGLQVAIGSDIVSLGPKKSSRGGYLALEIDLVRLARTPPAAGWAW